MYHSIFYTLLLLCTASFAQGQNLEEYHPLVCKGEIPKAYLTRSSDKYLRESKKIDKGDFRRKESKTRKAFALETNFVLDDLLQSGLVLFNDEVTQYLTEVINVVAEKDEDLRQRKIAVYTLRSPEVNAFATDRGDIFVTLGLLAQLEDEAQLAYILSHELVHIRERHSVELFLEKKGLNENSKNRSVLKETLFDDELLAHCAYSKEIEKEADSEGLHIFLKTDYDHSTLPVVLDVLKYSYLPFDDVPFDMDFLQSEHYRFPEKYLVKKVNPITDIGETADHPRSTHPGIGSRRQAMNAGLKGLEKGNKKPYIVSEERFQHLREIARFEHPMMYLRRDLFAQAIYSAYLLLEKHPDNPYLKKCVVKALYMDAKIKNGSDLRIDYEPEMAEGESHRVHYLLDKMPGKEVTILALRQALKLREQIPNDFEIEQITKDLFTELASRKLSPEDFISDAPEIKTGTETEATDLPAQHDADETYTFETWSQDESPQTTPQDTTEEALSKYDKIKEQKAEKIQPEKEEYWRFAFVGKSNGEAFTAAFAEGKKIQDKRKESDEYWASSKGRSEWRKKRNKIERSGHTLGIDKVVAINPYFVQLEKKKEVEVKHLRTESGSQDLKQLMKEMADKSGLKFKLLDVGDLRPDDVQAFNDIRFLNDWFSEQIEHFDLSLTPGYDQATINEIAERYQTDYFLWTGVLSMQQKDRLTAAEALFVWIPYAWPFMIADKLTPEHDMLYYAILYDVKTGRRQILKFDYFDRKASKDLLKAHFYDTFSQIKAKDK